MTDMKGSWQTAKPISEDNRSISFKAAAFARLIS
jgi:hypothetical protein